MCFFPSVYLSVSMTSEQLPGGSKHIKHGSVPASIYKTRDVVDVRDISVSRSKSDASSKHSQVAAGGGSDPSYPLLPSGYHQRDFIKEVSMNHLHLVNATINIMWSRIYSYCHVVNHSDYSLLAVISVLP